VKIAIGEMLDTAPKEKLLLYILADNLTIEDGPNETDIFQFHRVKKKALEYARFR